jgi:hypothetical protein
VRLLNSQIQPNEQVAAGVKHISGRRNKKIKILNHSLGPYDIACR